MRRAYERTFGESIQPVKNAAPRASRPLSPLDHLEDPVGDQAVGLTVHPRSGLRVRRLDQAERLVVLLVDPVPEVLHAIRILLGEVCLVRMGHVLRGRALWKLLVHIHVNRHVNNSSYKEMKAKGNEEQARGRTPQRSSTVRSIFQELEICTR